MTVCFVPNKNLLFREPVLLEVNITCQSMTVCFVTTKRNLLFRVQLFVLLEVNVTCYSE